MFKKILFLKKRCQTTIVDVLVMAVAVAV